MSKEATSRAATSIRDVVDDYLRDKGKGRDGDSGNYRRDAEREAERFIDFLETERPDSPSTFVELSVRDLREYARHLADQGWTEGTVQTYYAHVSGFCGWAAREGYLDGNLAQRTRAKEPLPEDTGRKSGDQQAWTTEQRDQMLAYVDEQARDAIETAGDDRQAAIKACRDRALVYLLCFSGVRSAEVLRDPNDDRRGRDGLRWADVSLEDNTLQVLGKKQKWDDRALPAPAVHPLKMLQKALNPPSDEWPVFHTLSYASLVQAFSKTLTERGFDAQEVHEIRTAAVNEGEQSIIELCVEYDVEPPAISTRGGRDVLERLSESAGIDLDGDKHGYLAPHGARRGAGEAMVRKYGHGAAARLLDNSEEIVREHYSHIEAGELAELATAAFEEIDDTDWSLESAEVESETRDNTNDN